MPVSTYTATSSNEIANTFKSFNAVSIYNAGPGTLYLLIHDNPDTSATVSASNLTQPLASGQTYESPYLRLGKYYGMFASAGTAYVTESKQV